ncbi:hypothetical protein ACWDX6_20445 [Streptomyces sp. NPDC003027]
MKCSTARRILLDDAGSLLVVECRLSPLKHRNLNLGRYSFTTSVPVGGLLPLRDPEGADLDEDDDARQD